MNTIQEVEEDDVAYIVKVGMILVFSGLQIVTDDQYWDLSCSYTGFKLRGTVYHANVVQ